MRIDDNGKVIAESINAWQILAVEMRDPSIQDPMRGKPKNALRGQEDDKHITDPLWKTGLNKVVGPLRAVVTEMPHWDKDEDGESNSTIKASVLKNLLKLDQGNEESIFMEMFNLCQNMKRKKKAIAKIYEQYRRKQELKKKSQLQTDYEISTDEVEELSW